MNDVKIQDVARLAGVSPSSISNYLNNRMGQMRPDTQQNIRQAIEQLGYRPNNAARQLKTGVAPMVGLLVPSLANQFFGSLACAVETAAARHQCHVMTFSTFRDPDRERSVMADLLAYGVQGIITGSALTDTDHLVAMTARCPVVAFDIKRSDNSARAHRHDLDRQRRSHGHGGGPPGGAGPPLHRPGHAAAVHARTARTGCTASSRPSRRPASSASC